MLNIKQKIDHFDSVLDSFFLSSYRVFIVPVARVLATPVMFIIRLFVPYKNISSASFGKSDFSYLVKIKTDLFRWKLQAFFFTFVCLAMLISSFSGGKSSGFFMPKYIAKIKIDKVITSEEYGTKEFIKQTLEKIALDKNVAAVIVEINSPGGTVTASEMLMRNLTRLSGDKTTYAVIMDMGTSGAYMAALGCRKIFAQETSAVGSIGVYSAITNYVEAATKLGLNFEKYKSSIYKASPNAQEKTLQEVSKYAQDGVNDFMQWFANVVQTRRQLSDVQLSVVANGKVFSGKKALQYGLIDSIGDEYDVLSLLIKENIVPIGTQIIEIQPPVVKNANMRRGLFSKVVNYVLNSINIAVSDSETGANLIMAKA
jgi:protease-4